MLTLRLHGCERPDSNVIDARATQINSTIITLGRSQSLSSFMNFSYMSCIMNMMSMNSLSHHVDTAPLLSLCIVTHIWFNEDEHIPRLFVVVKC